MKKIFKRLWYIVAAPYYWIQDIRFKRYFRKNIKLKKSAEQALTKEEEELFNKLVVKYNIKN